MVCVLMMEFAHVMLPIWVRLVTFQNVQTIVHTRMVIVIENVIDAYVRKNMLALIVDKELHMAIGRQLTLTRGIIRHLEEHHMAVQFIRTQCT